MTITIDNPDLGEVREELEAEYNGEVDRVDESVRANIRSLREALVSQVDLREVFLAMFPGGLSFEPARTPDGARQIWKISGDADFAAVTEPSLVSFGERATRSPTPTRSPAFSGERPGLRSPDLTNLFSVGSIWSAFDRLHQSLLWSLPGSLQACQRNTYTAPELNAPSSV